MGLKKMEKTNKNPVLVTKQRHGISSINIIRILAFLREYFKYIFFTLMVSIFAIWIGEMSGKIIAYLIWN